MGPFLVYGARMPSDRPHPQRTLWLVSMAALAVSMGQTTLIPAFSELVHDLHSSVPTVTWLLTGYLVASAVFTPLVGRLGDMFGKRRMLVLSLLAFVVGSVISALGTDVGVLITGRVVQGVGGGLFPLCFGIARDELPLDKVPGGVGLISATAGVGGGAGLLLGGVLVDAFGYASIFWLGAGLALVALVLIQLLVPESPVRVPARVDLAGAVVLGTGLVLLLVAVSQGHTWGWGSARTLVVGLASLVVLGLWVPLERRVLDPLVDVRLQAQPTLLVANAATLLIGFGLFGVFVLIPQIAEAPRSTGYGLGSSAAVAGLLMMPGSLSMLFTGPLSGALGAWSGHKVALAAGGALATGGLVLLAFVHSSGWALAGGYLVLSMGIGFAFAAMPNLILNAVPQTQTGQATGFNAVVRSVGSSLGGQVTAVVIASSAVSGSVVPQNSGYVSAFLLCAVVAAAGGALALLVPSRAGRAHVQLGDEIGAASPLGVGFAAEPARV